MSFNATVRYVGDVAVVDLAGRLTLGEGSGLIRTTIKDLAAKGHTKILLNLKDVSYIDSAGLGEMVGSYASVSSAGGSIKLLNPQGKVTSLLQVTKLYTVFVTFTDENEALRSFAAAAAGAQTP